MKILAAIDIGSNAARLYIKRIKDKESPYDPTIQAGTDFFLRVPLRIGTDVYTMGRISEEKESLLMGTILQFKVLMNLHKVEDYRACATASFRDAANGEEVAKRISRNTGIKIEIISGAEEISLTRQSYYAQKCAQPGNILFCDAGGGSTDISLANDGKELDSASFQVGSMRMSNHTQSTEEWERLISCLSGWAEAHGPLRVIGSGGCIHKMCHLFSAPETPSRADLSDIIRLHEELQPLTTEQKMARFHFKRDRAEIISEAIEIFIKIAQTVNAPFIEAPIVGVRDGVIVSLARKPW